MDIEAVRRKAKEAILPLESVDINIYGGDRTKAGQELPEYYLVYFLLVDLLGFYCLGRREKVAWSIPVDLEGQLLSIEHRKLGLGVFSRDGDDSEAAASEVVRLIHNGIRVAEPYFEWRAAQAVKDSTVNVVNEASNLYQRFEFLLSLYEAKRVEYEESIGKVIKTAYGNNAWGFEIPSFRLSYESEWLALSAIESLFSWTEHVFIHLAILQGRCLTGECVKELAADNWQTKFKTALNLDDPKLKYYYDELTSIRYQVRNFVAHGAFGKEGEAFRFHSGAGAVPVKLPHRDGKHSYSFRVGFDISRIDSDSFDHRAIILIQEFIDYIRTGQLTPAWIYLDEGLDLVLKTAQSGKYKLAMQSEENMKEFTEYLNFVVDSYANMEFWI